MPLARIGYSKHRSARKTPHGANAVSSAFCSQANKRFFWWRTMLRSIAQPTSPTSRYLPACYRTQAVSLVAPCSCMRLPLTVLTSQCAKEKRVIPTLQIWNAARSAFRRTAARHGRSRLARAAFGHGAGAGGRCPGKAIGNGYDYLFHLLGGGVKGCQDLHCCLSPSPVSGVGFCLFLSNWSDDRGPLRTRRYCKRASGSLQGALPGGSDRRRQDLEVVLATAKKCARQRSEPIRRRVPSGMRT